VPIREWAVPTRRASPSTPSASWPTSTERPLLWDTADPFSPLTWMDQSAVIDHGSPWALAAGGGADWLAPDWQGTIGNDARDPWGAAQSAPDPGVGAGLRLGYRGELEFDGETWLRNRAYDPASRSFLQPDPLEPVPGTTWAANPCHYAGNNPIGLSNPLGLRPITDAELQKYRDRMSNNAWQAAGHWFKDNWEYVAAGAAVAAGVALMCTGVSGPAGIALMAASGALISGGVSVATQKHDGEVNWAHVGVDAATGALAGGVFGSVYKAGMLVRTLSSGARA
jgi:RHS repeat-associated protein